jgi:hypothetical protein
MKKERRKRKGIDEFSSKGGGDVRFSLCGKLIGKQGWKSEYPITGCLTIRHPV